MDWSLLSRVARSFAITIRWLPGEIRETVALGYLLARASDSIADSSDAPRELRLMALEGLIDGEVSADELGELVAGQSVGAEAELLAALPDLVASMRASKDRERLEWVWRHILRGQTFDLQRFSDSSEPLSAEELGEYTYSVAGAVGEFWTELSFDRVPRFSRSQRTEMVALGARYGKGLQLINILRDRAADREIGRVYVADDAVGRVLGEATSGLVAGVEWASRVDRRRMSYACVLPARIGMEMIPELSAGSRERVKISKSRLRRVMWRELRTIFESNGAGRAGALRGRTGPEAKTRGKTGRSS